MYKTICITGASSGLGRALAEAYASPVTTLLLTGRDAKRLLETEERCIAKGAVVISRPGIDIRNEDDIMQWIQEMDRLHPIDLLIANAGISGGTEGGREHLEQIKQLLEVNINGVLYAIHAVLPLMLARNKGQIAIMSSLAGFIGLPTAPAYAASKAAIRIYGEGMRGMLARQGIGVTVIAPGFIHTPMTDINPFPMPFIMSAEKAASIIRGRLRHNPSHIIFPRLLYAGIRIIELLPSLWKDCLFMKVPAKPELKKK